MGTWNRNNLYLSGGTFTSNNTPAVEGRGGEIVVKKSSHIIPTIPIDPNILAVIAAL